MNDTLKYIWVGLMLFCIFGLVISIPVQKYQDKLKTAILKKKYAPQARVDATQKYIDAVEIGTVDTVYSFGYSPEFLEMAKVEFDNKTKSENMLRQTPSDNVRKPLYIRDKNNPNILYKYSDVYK